MKIYGKDFDYYDCALSFGQDPLCVWNRKFEINKPDKKVERDTSIMLSYSHIERTYDYSFRDEIDLFKGYVFFCGKTYPFIGYKNNYFYSYDSLLKELVKYYTAIELNNIFNSTKYSYQFSSKITLKTQVEKFFNIKANSDMLHRIKNIPVYIVYQNTEYVGGRLKDFSFFKVFDPVICFQEINMYISGVLGGQSPKLIEIADKYKIVSKGFDTIKSFRNMKR